MFSGKIKIASTVVLLLLISHFSMGCVAEEECEECHGTGHCQKCGGDGGVADGDCPYCDGSGDCPECGGDGRKSELCSTIILGIFGFIFGAVVLISFIGRNRNIRSPRRQKNPKSKSKAAKRD